MGPGTYILWSTLLCCVVACLSTLRFYHGRLSHGGRVWEDYISDIRALNTYNSYFLGALTLFVGLALQGDAELIPKQTLLMVLLAILFSAISVLFIPVLKPGTGEANPEVKRLWLFTLIPSQWVVILSFGGIAAALLPILL